MAEIITGQEAVLQGAKFLHDHIDGRTAANCIETRFCDLDYLINGIKPGTLTILASLPGTGKTTFALNLFKRLMMAETPKRILFCTGGLSAANAAISIAQLLAGIKSITNDMDIPSAEINKFFEAMGKIKNIPFWIDSSWGMPADDLVDKIRQHISKNPLDLCIIDAFQLLKFPNNEITAQTIKALAEESKVPIWILYSQEDGKNQLHMEALPWKIVDSADTVIIMNRKRKPHLHRNKSVSTYFSVERNLCGTTGIAELRFFPETRQYKNLYPERTEEE